MSCAQQTTPIIKFHILFLTFSSHLSSPRSFKYKLPDTNKMGSTAAEHHSSFAFEQSLRRSFYAIHHSPLDASLPRLSHVRNHRSNHSDGSGSDIKVQDDSLFKRDCHGKDIRKKSILRCNWRASLPTDMPSRMIRAFLSNDLPAPPFSKGESPQPQRDSSRERPAKKFQRQYSSVKADIAQIKVTKLTWEKQHV